MNSPIFTNPRQGQELKAPADYGKLGPGADVTLAGPEAPPQTPQPARKAATNLAAARFIAIAVGIIGAIVAGNVRHMATNWNHLSGSVSKSSQQRSGSGYGRTQSQKAQNQAETLLELAIGNSPGALEQISNQVDSWRGRLQWDSRIANLTSAALNSNDMRVREAGVEVELAAYNVVKNSAQVDLLAQEAQSGPHDQKIWALWTLGLLANRGIETERVVATLADHLKDSDVDSRRWAVESLALVGSTSTISPLLQIMHDDPAPLVRERAACSLAESGMLTHEQRMTAVPQLVSYSDDPALDPQTHGWAFQALSDITHQHLPNDSAAWRSWYENNGAAN